jgi:hypothetical protein
MAHVEHSAEERLLEAEQAAWLTPYQASARPAGEPSLPMESAASRVPMAGT